MHCLRRRRYFTIDGLDFQLNLVCKHTLHALIIWYTSSYFELGASLHDLQVCVYILDVYPELLKSAALFIEVGSTRAAELGALLIGNLAFDESALSALSTMDIDVSRLLSLIVEGGDRARELGTLALANLTRIDKFVHQFLAEDGAIEVILSVRGSEATGRAREAAGRVVTNCSVYRLQSNGTKLALGKAKAMSESKCVSGYALPFHTIACLLAVFEFLVPVFYCMIALS